MQSVQELLQTWNLGQYAEKFNDEEIDLATLLILSTRDIEQLIPKAGPRARFIWNRDLYKIKSRHENEGNSEVQLVNNHNTSSDQDSFRTDTTSISESDTSTASTSTINDPPSNSDISVFERSITGLNFPTTAGQKLKELLAKSAHRRSLLKQTRLTALDRRQLVETIIDHLFEKDLKIRSPTFQFWANEIVHVFKYERAGTYFVPHVPGSDGRLAGGKLWCRYCNVKRYVKKRYLNQNSQPSIEDLSEEIKLEKDQLYAELRTISPDDEQAVKKLWVETYDFRMNDKFAIHDYYTTFPILATPIGSSLLQLDFEKSKICDPTACIKRWADIAVGILRVAVERKVDLPFDVGNILSETAALLVLTYLLAPTNVKSGNKKKWRPSAIEQGNGFILHINAMTDLEQELDRIKNQLRLYGLTLQPLVVALGQPTNFDAVYVMVNEVKYNASCLLSAVDMCFKIHYALSAKYNAQSEQLWAFMEKFVYEITTTKHYNNIEVLWTDIMSE